MKVVFVDLGLGLNSFNTFGNSHWASVIHHGVCSISAYLKREGHQVELIDIRRLKGWDEFGKELRQKEPEVLAISIRSCDLLVADKVMNIARAWKPDMKIVVGGPHPTAMPDETAKDERINYIVIGEGEVTLNEILSDIASGNGNQRIRYGKHPDLDSLPFEDREIYDYGVSVSLPNYPGIFKAPMVTMITCRGCYFRCSFCAPHAETTFGKKMRYRNVESVIEELRALKNKWNFKSLKFYNSDFFANSKWVHEFSRAYRQAGFREPILVQTRASSLCKDEIALKAMKEAGVKLIIMGWESGSQRILDFIKKGCRVEHNVRSAELCRKYGIMVCANFMFGLPTETVEDIQATVELAKYTSPHFTSVSFFTPLPGTYLYHYVQEHGLSLIKSPEDFSSFAPGKPKIKGVDYDSARLGAEKILGLKFGGRWTGKIVRLLYVGTKKNLKLRQFLVYCYSRYIGSWLYHLVQQIMPRRSLQVDSYVEDIKYTGLYDSSYSE